MVQEETIHFNPFPGLRAFEEEEDVLFFGREKQVDELLKKLRTSRFLVVIGSSGSGKSSLVKSGLIPALYSGLMAGAGSNWRMCTFRPGNDPVGNMAKALSEDGVLYHQQTEADVQTYSAINESILRRSNLGLIEAYRQSGIDPKNKLLVLVDQFEEIFRFSRYEKENKEGKRDAVAFINLLLKATEQKELPIYVVFTMRSDFLGDCTEFRGLPEAINEGQYLVPRMTREERRDAITGPVAVGGAEIAPRLLNQLLNDVGDNPDQLPILQHALMRTWDIWKKKNADERPLDLEDYEEVGTMSHALSQHAEEAYAELETDKERQICESLFKALTDKGSDARGIRRPRRLSEICELSGANIEEVKAIIEIFRKKGRGFLMPPVGVELNESTIIDISHESIMRVWERLMDWVDEENQSAEVYLRLCEAANLYESGKGSLWRDPELQLAWKWKEENNPNATWASRYNDYFDKAILFLEHSKKQSELQLLHKELMQKRRLKRAKIVAIVIALIALIAFLLAINSFRQKTIADKQKQIAVLKSAEALKQQKIAQQQTKIAVQKGQEALEQKMAAEASKNEALAQKAIAEKQRIKAQESEQRAKMQEAIAKSEKERAEKQKIIAEENAEIARQQTAIAKELKERAEANERVAIQQKELSNKLKDLAESRNLANQAILLLNESKATDSKKLALDAYELNEKNEGPKQNSEVYAALSFNWNKSINYTNQALYHQYPVKCMVFKPKSNILFTTDESGLIYTSKAENGIVQPISKINIKQDIRSIAVSPDGNKLLVATAMGKAFIYTINTNSTLLEIGSFAFAGIATKALFVNNNYLFVLSNKEIKRVKIEANNALVLETSVAADQMNAIALTKAGKIYAAFGNKILVYNSWNDVLVNTAQSYELASKITSLSIDESENYVAAGTYDGGVWIKDLKSNKQPFSQNIHKSMVNDLKFHTIPSGNLQLATAGADQTVQLIDVKAATNKVKEDILVLRGHSKWVYQTVYSADGAFVYSSSEDKRIFGWHTSTNGLYKTLNR